MFDKHFEVFLADTPESKEIHFFIRYQVYCEEMAFENKDDYPSKMEQDDNDARSVHFIVRNKMTGQWIGAMRLIDKQGALLPIEQSCTLDEKISTNDLNRTVELSRLCLIKEVRRQFKSITLTHGMLDSSNQPEETAKVKIMPNQQKLNRMIIWGLIHAAAEYCYFNNVQNWYFMTTCALAKILRRGGLSLSNIGQPCQHKGERFPFKMNAVETYQNQIWPQGGYENGYRLYSELDVTQSSNVMAVA